MRKALAEARTSLRTLDGTIGAAVARVEAKAKAAETGMRAAAARVRMPDDASVASARAGLAAAVSGARDQAQALRGRIATIDRAVATAEARLGELERGADQALALLQEDFVGRLDAIRAPLAQAVAAARAALGAAREQLGGVTGGVLAGVELVERAITAIRDTGDTLVQSLETALATGLSALGAIPVDALPEALASTTRTAITRASTAAGQALSTAATTASQQLQPIGQQIGGQIDQARSAAITAVQEGAQTILTGIKTATTQVESAARPIAGQIEAALGTLETQIATQLDTLRSTVEAAARPVLAQVQTVTTEVSAGTDRIVQQAEVQIAAIERR